MGLRDLSASEHQLLTELLAHDVDGVEVLRLQLADARVASSCRCGCGSIGFVAPDPDAVSDAAATLFPIEGEVLDDEGEVIGGLLLFLRSGRLHDLEVFSVGPTSLPLPDVSHVRWTSRL